MRILDIRQQTIPLPSASSNAAISFSGMTASIVALITDQKQDGKPVIGYGVDPMGRYGHGNLLAERFAPRVLAADPESLLDASGRNFDPAKVWRAAMKNEKPGGHGERAGAVGLLDTAVWDLVAKLARQPLWQYLAAHHGPAGGAAPKRVRTYASGGYYYAARGHDALKAEIKGMLDRGYTHVKIKAGMGEIDGDRRRIEAALEVLGTGDRLAVDFSGTFDRARAEAYLDAVAPYKLRWIEEIGDPLDFDLQSALSRNYAMPFATGENIFSAVDARNLLRYGGLRPERDFLQFDIALSYGLVEYLRTLELCEQAGWSRRQIMPHAGHVFALHAVGGLGLAMHESAPNEVELLGGYPDGCRVSDGMVDLPDTPGIGFERKNNLHGPLCHLAE